MVVRGALGQPARRAPWRALCIPVPPYSARRVQTAGEPGNIISNFKILSLLGPDMTPLRTENRVLIFSRLHFGNNTIFFGSKMNHSAVTLGQKTNPLGNVFLKLFLIKVKGLCKLRSGNDDRIS